LTFARELSGQEIPHHLQPGEVHRFLWGTFANAEVKELIASKRPLPGDNLSLADRQARKRADDKTAKLDEILSRSTLTKEEQYVFGGNTTCGLCHYFESQPDKVVPSRIVATNVPAVWFPSARFSHRPHRAIDCLACHEKANESK